ncbi:insulinase family protein [Marinicauda algicola]|uniref:Insulinase family protein n=1 Tax=Marinicauda algicola TaxID=2029849 RepID=A0A4S2GWL3_9PROT|nr:insulinase family protein [Marinicauda algicola]TGY87436.1 insulinase family protein [Marinicauda algicola]
MRFQLCAALTALGLAAALPPAFAAAGDDPLITGPIRSFTAPQGFQVVIARAEAPEGIEPRILAGLYTRHGQATEAIPGLAHFSEHVFANARASIRDWSYPEGSDSLDSNAQARSDYVSAWLTINKPDGTDASGLALALSYSAKLWGFAVPEELVETQRQRILDELERTGAYGQYRAQYALEHAFYGNRPEIEAESALAGTLSRQTIEAYQAIVYRPENVTLVVAGDLDPAAMEGALLAAFATRGPLPQREPLQPEGLLRADAIVEDAGPVIRRFDTLEGDWVAAGFAAPASSDPDFAALLVLDQYLLGGRGPFETLWQVSRAPLSPLGRALAGRASVTALSDARGYGAAIPPLAERAPAYFTILFGGPELDPAAAPSLLQSALADVRTGMSDDAILEARDQLLDFYRRWLNAANLRPLGDHLAGLSFQDPSAPERLMMLHSELAAVTPDAVRAAMDRYLLEGAWRYGIVDGQTAP